MDEPQLSITEVEAYAVERLFDLALTRANSGLTFVERRQLQNTERWLRENTDGTRAP